LSFQVTEDLDNTLYTTRCGYAGMMPGVIRPEFEWKISKC
jgi:hypothetical protein